MPIVMTRRFILIPAVILGFLAAAHSAVAANVPSLKPTATDPAIDAAKYASILVIDTASGKTLFSLNPGKPWPAASLTKLMTADLFAAGRKNWNAKGSILKADEVGGGRLQVPSGTVLTYRDLLYSAIIGSANNAASALARLSGRGAKGFVKEMNRMAGVMGMTGTSYADASGMNPKNVTTAADIALILDAASKQPEIRKAMLMPTYRFAVATPPRLRSGQAPILVMKTIKNTNGLLSREPKVTVTAGKTGYLEESMYNFTAKVKPGSETGRELAIVVLGAPSRGASQDTSAILAKWAWDSFAWSGTSTAPVRFDRNLVLGARGAEVKALQKTLNEAGFAVAAQGPGSPGHETELLGPLTAAAIKKFQTAHAAEILAPFARKQGSGALDFATRAYLNK